MAYLNLDKLKAIDATNRELRERNEIRLAAAKAAMGRQYLLHPENSMSREKFNKIALVTA